MESESYFKRRSPYSFQGLLSLLKETTTEWSNDKVPRLGAALAYYTVFSLAPLLIIFITIAGLAFDNASSQVMSQIEGLFGEKGSEMIQSMIEAARKPADSIVSTALGFLALIFGAAGVFIQLKDSLNTIWNVPPPKASGIWAFIRKYFLSFTVVLGIGFLLLVSLIISAGLAMLGDYFSDSFEGMNVVMKIISFIVSFGTVTCLFAMLFKFLPDAKVRWRDVWLGAAFTAFLFAVGKFALGFYLGSAGVASAYGAAGSLVLVLLWVYYSSQILFFGAEFTAVYACHHGSRSEKVLRRTAVSTRKSELIREIEDERAKISKTFKPIFPKRKPPHHRFKRHLGSHED